MNGPPGEQPGPAYAIRLLVAGYFHVIVGGIFRTLNAPSPPHLLSQIANVVSSLLPDNVGAGGDDFPGLLAGFGCKKKANYGPYHCPCD